MTENLGTIILIFDDRVEQIAGTKDDVCYRIRRRIEKGGEYCTSARFIDSNIPRIDVNKIIEEYNNDICKWEEEQRELKEKIEFERLKKKYN